jgi:hypothetical protein
LLSPCRIVPCYFLSVVLGVYRRGGHD